MTEEEWEKRSGVENYKWFVSFLKIVQFIFSNYSLEDDKIFITVVFYYELDCVSQ